MAEMVKTEEILGQKWDKCVLDAGIKMSSGLAIGKLFKWKIFLKIYPILTPVLLCRKICQIFDTYDTKELSENYYQIYAGK